MSAEIEPSKMTAKQWMEEHTNIASPQDLGTVAHDIGEKKILPQRESYF